LKHPKNLRLAATAVVLAVVLFDVLSCATPLRIEASVDPLSVLEPGSILYVRLSGATAREFAPALFRSVESASLKPVLDRTSLLAFGLGTASAIDSRKMPFQACLIGDYPFRAASFSLSANPDWKREKGTFYNSALGLRAAVPGPNLILASSGPLEPLLAGATSPGPSPIPESLADLASRELVLWAPDPFTGLASAILGEAMEVPVRGLLISASPIASTNAGTRDYEATIVFLMADADSARLYRPALKLAWYGIARGLLGDDASGPLGANFSLEGDTFRASGVRLSGAALVRTLSSLRGWLGGIAPDVGSPNGG
jgi:hypothetical protein